MYWQTCISFLTPQYIHDPLCFLSFRPVFVVPDSWFTTCNYSHSSEALLSLLCAYQLPVLAQICEALATAGVLLFQSLPYLSPAPVVTPEGGPGLSWGFSVLPESDEEADRKASECKATRSCACERAGVAEQTGQVGRDVWVVHRFYFRLLDRILLELAPDPSIDPPTASLSRFSAGNSQRGAVISVSGTIGEESADRPFASISRGSGADMSEIGQKVLESAPTSALDIGSIARVTRAICSLQRKSVDELENRLAIEVQNLRRGGTPSGHEPGEVGQGKLGPAVSIAEGAREKVQQETRVKKTAHPQDRVEGMSWDNVTSVGGGADKQHRSLVVRGAVERGRGGVEGNRGPEGAAVAATCRGPMVDAGSSVSDEDTKRRIVDLSEQLHQARCFFAFFFDQVAAGLLAAMLQKSSVRGEKTPPVFLSERGADGVDLRVRLGSESPCSVSPSSCASVSPSACIQYACGGAETGGFAEPHLGQASQVREQGAWSDCWEAALSPRFFSSCSSEQQLVSLLLALTRAARLLAKGHQTLLLQRPLPAAGPVSPSASASAFRSLPFPSLQSTCPAVHLPDASLSESGRPRTRSGNKEDKLPLPFLVPCRIQPPRLLSNELRPLGSRQTGADLSSGVKAVAVSFSPGMACQQVSGASDVVVRRLQSPFLSASLSSSFPCPPAPPATSAVAWNDLSVQFPSSSVFSTGVLPGTPEGSSPAAQLPSCLSAAVVVLSSLVFVQIRRLPQAAVLGLYVQLSRCPFDAHVARQMLLREGFLRRREKEGRDHGGSFPVPSGQNEIPISPRSDAVPGSLTPSMHRSSSFASSVSSSPVSGSASSSSCLGSCSQSSSRPSPTFLLREWPVVIHALLGSFLQRPSGLLRELPARDIPSFMFALVQCLARLDAAVPLPSSCSLAVCRPLSPLSSRRSTSSKAGTRTSANSSKDLREGSTRETCHDVFSENCSSSSPAACSDKSFPPRFVPASPREKPQNGVDNAAAAALLPVLARRLAFEQHWTAGEASQRK